MAGQTFEEAHDRWLSGHLSSRRGERRGRLERGHGHGEQLFLKQVWWPLFGNFDNLHLEYEVLDWRGYSYYADLAWLSGEARILGEIKGFGPHVRDMDRKRYCDELKPAYRSAGGNGSRCTGAGGGRGYSERMEEGNAVKGNRKARMSGDGKESPGTEASNSRVRSYRLISFLESDGSVAPRHGGFC
ncbi:hypothetical protein ACFSL6_07020 [Paenibacillus thailandensis]|uniref:DUF1064 domain-containing protein n=1 Tax=Paenibacillus thailandensis TaxID=393250 RepID=A0ABW5R4W9_9BACL